MSLTICIEQHRVFSNGEEVFLTPIEYRMLKLLVEKTNCVVTRDEILVTVWNEGYALDFHILQVNMSRLRKKLNDSTFIKTRPGMGYIIKGERNDC